MALSKPEAPEERLHKSTFVVSCVSLNKKGKRRLRPTPFAFLRRHMHGRDRREAFGRSTGDALFVDFNASAFFDVLEVVVNHSNFVLQAVAAATAPRDERAGTAARRGGAVASAAGTTMASETIRSTS